MREMHHRSGWRVLPSVQIALLAVSMVFSLVIPMTPQVSAATTNVSIVDFAFQSSLINVQLGDTVIWTNNGVAPHTVTSDGGSGPLDSPTLNTGGTYYFNFTSEGTYNYHCTFHPQMKGTVIVGQVVPEYSGVSLVAIGLMGILLVLAALGRRR